MNSWIFSSYYGSYFLLVVPALLVAAWAQWNVTNTFNKYNKVANRRGLTGAQTARAILDMHGLQNIPVERVAGSMTDHYDPRTNVIRLSTTTHDSPSVGAIGVAAHECGHAIQYAEKYAFIKLRTGILPICQIGSSISMPMVLLGLLFGIGPLVTIGIYAFVAVVVFQLVTLPVEFNASNRAMAELESTNLLEGDELVGAGKVLQAAALTYVAALLVSVMSLVRLLALSNRRK